MTALRWLSDSLRRISARERRFVLAGAIASATLVVLVLIVLPFARRWTARETTYAASSEQWARLAGLAAGGGRLRRDRDAQRMAQSTEQARLVTGATPALAASSLQGLLQRYAGESAVQLDRVDVAGQPRTDEGGLLAIPVQLQGQGDVYGLVDFLYRLQAGERLLVIEEMTVNAGTWDPNGRQTLIWAIRLHGLYAGTGSRS